MGVLQSDFEYDCDIRKEDSSSESDSKAQSLGARGNMHQQAPGREE